MAASTGSTSDAGVLSDYTVAEGTAGMAGTCHDMAEAVAGPGCRTMAVELLTHCSETQGTEISLDQLYRSTAGAVDSILQAAAGLDCARCRLASPISGSDKYNRNPYL